MARYIDADALWEEIKKLNWSDDVMYHIVKVFIEDAPTADVVEVETVRAWLYEMAFNNVGCVVNGDFSEACEEIISRLDGLRNFARDRSDGYEG